MSKSDLVFRIHKKRVEVASAMLAVDAIATDAGPDLALEKISEAEELIKEYKKRFQD